MRVQEISELLMFLLQAAPFLPTGADTWLEVSILSTSQSTSVPRPTKGRKTWWLAENPHGHITSIPGLYDYCSF